MATSTKVQFRLETLKEKALESIDFRISQKQLEVASFDDDATLSNRIDEWRVRQVVKLDDLIQRINEVDNLHLSKFRLDPIPEIDRYDRSRVERDLRSLEAMRSQILTKGSSLVADEEGNISLTSTQLSEFFGL